MIERQTDKDRESETEREIERSMPWAARTEGDRYTLREKIP